MSSQEQFRPVSGFQQIATAAAGSLTQHMRENMGPFGADQSVRQAIMTCWRMLPEESRTPERVEQEVRRLLERALSEFREDSAAFGFSGGGA